MSHALRIPYETYFCLLIAANWEYEDIQDEMDLLRLPCPKRKNWAAVQKDMATFTGKSRKAPAKLKRWADRRNLDYKLLNINNKRVQDARAVCFNSRIRHTLELCLLNPRMPWDEIVSKVSTLGRPRGLIRQIVEDFQQLFWNFSLMNIQERETYFKQIGATAGMRAASEGYPLIGLSVDFGVKAPISDEERLTYMRDMAFLQFARHMHSGQPNAKSALCWTENVLKLDERIQQVAPVEIDAAVEFDGGVIEMIPSIDHLDERENEHALPDPSSEEEEEDDPNGRLIPFVPQQG